MIHPQSELPNSRRHALPDRPIRGVLVYYQPSRDGRAALAHGLALADDAGASLTVAAVTPQDRTDVGCAHCRATNARWNAQMRVVAHEQLSELAADLGESSPAVRYLAACGPTAPVLCAAAEQDGVDVIVLPHRRAERLRRLLRASLFEQLRRRCGSEIVVAPCRAGADRARA